MKVYIIKYEWMEGRKLCVFNKRGNCLEVIDKEHAEYFLKNHPEAVYGHPYEIVEQIHTDEDQMEYGRPTNVWEYEDREPIKEAKQMTLFDFME